MHKILMYKEKKFLMGKYRKISWIWHFFSISAIGRCTKDKISKFHKDNKDDLIMTTTNLLRDDPGQGILFMAALEQWEKVVFCFISKRQIKAVVILQDMCWFISSLCNKRSLGYVYLLKRRLVNIFIQFHNS